MSGRAPGTSGRTALPAPGRVRSPRAVPVGLTKADAEQYVISVLNDLA